MIVHRAAGYDKGFKQWVTRGITAWYTLVKDGELESFQNMKDKYGLDKNEFYRYLQLRDYYRKEIKIDASKQSRYLQLSRFIKSMTGMGKCMYF